MFGSTLALESWSPHAVRLSAAAYGNTASVSNLLAFIGTPFRVTGTPARQETWTSPAGLGWVVLRIIRLR